MNPYVMCKFLERRVSVVGDMLSVGLGTGIRMSPDTFIFCSLYLAYACGKRFPRSETATGRR